MFNVVEDPCEYVDLSARMPQKLNELEKRLEAYQAVAVPKGRHTLSGINCTSPSPEKHPEWHGFWMPFCAATALPGALQSTSTRLAGNETGVVVLREADCDESGCAAALDAAYAACEANGTCEVVLEPWVL